RASDSSRGKIDQRKMTDGVSRAVQPPKPRRACNHFLAQCQCERHVDISGKLAVRLTRRRMKKGNVRELRAERVDVLRRNRPRIDTVVNGDENLHESGKGEKWK